MCTVSPRSSCYAPSALTPQLALLCGGALCCTMVLGCCLSLGSPPDLAVRLRQGSVPLPDLCTLLNPLRNMRGKLAQTLVYRMDFVSKFADNEAI